jgi:HEAT repeat protein
MEHKIISDRLGSFFKDSQKGFFHGSIHNLLFIALNDNEKPDSRIAAIKSLGTKDMPLYVASALGSISNRSDEDDTVRIAAIEMLSYALRYNVITKILKSISDCSYEESEVREAALRSLQYGT